MKKARVGLCFAMVAVLALGTTGCSTMRITMNPKAPTTELSNKKIPFKVALLLDSEFVNYHWQGKSGAELSNLDYDLGSASKSLFLEAFMIVSKGVVLVDTKPPYSDPGRSDIVVVVQPRIVGFSEEHNAFLRVVNYYSEITYHVSVFDRMGMSILDKDYKVKGVALGQRTLSPGSNYAAPAENAMAQAIVLIIDDISKLKMASE